MNELINYIKAARESGENDESIILSLKSVGWDDTTIAENMKQVIPDLDKSAFPEPLPDVSLNASVAPAQNLATSIKKFSFNFKTLWKYGKYVLAFIMVAGLVSGGYYAYSYFISTPEKVWAKALSNMANLESASFIFETSYTEKIPKEKSDLGFLGNIEEVKFSANGNGKLSVDPIATDLDYTMNSTLGAKLGTISFNMEFESLKKGDFVYYKMNNNPFAQIFGMGSDESLETSDWIKLNLKESTNDDTKLLTAQKDLLLEAYKKANIVKLVKLINTEKINEKNALHYQAEIDKNELKKYFESIKDILDDTDEKMNIDYSSFIDKLEYKQMEVWIGKSDRKIYQVLVETNFPSLMSSLSSSLETARNTSRDAVRLADVRQIQTALELFYNDNGGYPGATNGQIAATEAATTGGKAWSTYVITDWPTAPTPTDGSCSAADNVYTYAGIGVPYNGTYPAYSLKFCIGSTTGGFSPGVMEASQTGMRTVIPSTGVNKSVDIFKDVPFNSTLYIKVNFSDFNSQVNIETPKDAVDVGAKSRDAKRLSDIRQVQTALELFYNDSSHYPKSINGQIDFNDGGSGFTIPDYYLETFPTAPTPPDGSCTEANNKFTYEQLNGGADYKLSFCLGGKTSGYEAGVRQATASGIK